jgi:hypothetical protein
MLRNEGLIADCLTYATLPCRIQVCGDPQQFQVLCTGCAFPHLDQQPRCELRGCLGSALNMTEDGLQNVTYSRGGVVFTAAIEDGDLMIGESLKVECPVGYRIPTTDITTVIGTYIPGQGLTEDPPIKVETHGPSQPEVVISDVVGTGSSKIITTTTTTTVQREGPTNAADAQHAMSDCTSEVTPCEQRVCTCFL